MSGLQDRPDANLEAPRGRILCLSGGGFRAMLFHLGACWRLNQAGRLAGLDAVSSVSGGSILAGRLAVAWRDLEDAGFSDDAFRAELAMPVLAFARRSVDVAAVLRGVLGPKTVAHHVARAYDRHLLHGATLGDLPEAPRFVFNATNLQTKQRFRFMCNAIGGPVIGDAPAPHRSLAEAVAASSAFPPVLGPARLKGADLAWGPSAIDGEADDEDRDGARPERLRKRIRLSDGGVYDNLGVAPAIGFDEILVCNAGGRSPIVERPPVFWPTQFLRAFRLINDQVRVLRKREVLDEYRAGRAGAYWSIRLRPQDYPAGTDLRFDAEDARGWAKAATRLRPPKEGPAAALVNWGYATTDIALRAHVDPRLPAGAFPMEGGIPAPR